MHEIAECYRSALAGETPDSEPLQYADLSEWQNESLQAEGAEPGIDYWRKQQLAGAELLLPYEKPQTAVEFQAAAPVSVSIDTQLTKRLQSLSELNGTTLSSTLLGAFYVVLSRLCSATQLSLGVSFDGRHCSAGTKDDKRRDERNCHERRSHLRPAALGQDANRGQAREDGLDARGPSGWKEIRVAQFECLKLLC